MVKRLQCFCKEKCKIIYSRDDVVSKYMLETLWGFIKDHYVFPSEQEKIRKNAMLKTISNALQRFRHALNKYYVQRGLSPLNRFGYIMPNEWDTFVQQHTPPEVVALSNKMNELNAKNKFRHKLGHGEYKVAMPKWVKKEQELRETRIPDPFEGCMVHTRNWIRGHSHTDDSGRLFTSSSKVTSMVEKAETLDAKGKTGEFKSQQERDQLSVALENEEHPGRTRAISSIASWKEGFTDESHMYKKHITHEIMHNAEETFAQQFFNFMREPHNMLYRCLFLKSI
jgi:hypothetical protein